MVEELVVVVLVEVLSPGVRRMLDRKDGGREPPVVMGIVETKAAVNNNVDFALFRLSTWQDIVTGCTHKCGICSHFETLMDKCHFKKHLCCGSTSRVLDGATLPPLHFSGRECYRDEPSLPTNS